MQNNHTRTAWILSLVYCSKLYYELRRKYKGRKNDRAFNAYANLRDALLSILCIKLWNISKKHPIGILETWLWICDK